MGDYFESDYKYYEDTFKFPYKITMYSNEYELLTFFYNRILYRKYIETYKRDY